MNKVRWGLVSTAHINRRLIPAIRASRRGELVAVASRNRATAAAYARKWDIPQAFGSYESMLESGAVDAVYISLPNNLHCEWTVRALQAGVHVLCEKPFALSLAEVDDMIAAAASSGRVLAEAFMYRHHPQMKLVQEWVRGGRLGAIRLVRGVFGFKIASPDNIRLDPSLGGGCLWDVGVYPVSFAQYIMGGPPRWVMGDQWVGASGVDEFFSGQMHYGDGVMAQIAGSFCSPYYAVAEVIGEEGRLSLTRPFLVGIDGREAEVLLYRDDDSAAQALEVQPADPYQGEVEDMHAAILDGAAPLISLEETRNHVRTVLALYAAAASAAPVRLS